MPEGHHNGVQLLMDETWVVGTEGHPAVAWLVVEKGADMDKATNSGRTPLFIACQVGHLEAVRLLVGKGSSPNLARSDEQTPLIAAVCSGHFAVVQLLLPLVTALNTRVIDSPTHPHRSGKTALGLAIAKGHTAVVELLRSAGAHE